MKSLKRYFLFLFVLLIIITIFIGFNKVVVAVDTCPGTPTISYGGKTYDTVQIGTQCWLKQNMSIGTKILGTQNPANNNVIEKYCFNDLDSNCDIYGGLYQWAEAVQYKNGATNTTNWSPVPIGDVQGICPVGWHIPTVTEKTTLENYLGGSSVAGGKKKEAGTVFWLSPNTGAANSSGFSDRGSGYFLNGSFANLLYYSNLWTTTTAATNVAYYFGSAYNYSAVSGGQGYKHTGYSIRCIKNSGTNTTVPDAPTNLTGVFGLFGTSVNLSWTAPVNNGGSPITSYKVEYKQTSATTWTSTSSTTTSKTITGLVAGNSYDYRVSAVNTIGTGPSVSITAPGQVTGLTATPGNGQVTLNWTAPTNGGSPLTNYIVEYKLTSASTWSSITIPYNSTTKTITNLTNGSSYDFKVRAWGSSAGVFSSVVSKTPVAPATAPIATAPGAPTNLQLNPVLNTDGTYNLNKVNLGWTAPTNNGGSPITGYKIDYRIKGVTSWTTTTSTTTTKTIDVTAGIEYEFVVNAVNAIGTSNNGPMVTSPAKMTGVIVTPNGAGKLLVSWPIPNNGGSPIIEYRLRYKATDATFTSLSDWGTMIRIQVPNATSTEIIGLTSGKSYQVKIRAINGIFGAWSDETTAVAVSSIAQNNLIADAMGGVGGINANISPNTICADCFEDEVVSNNMNNMFDVNLSYGKTHRDIKRLQSFLNSKGYTVVPTGKETTYFGKATKAALIKFQQENDIIPASGNFGPTTRSVVNNILNK